MTYRIVYNMFTISVDSDGIVNNVDTVYCFKSL